MRRGACMCWVVEATEDIAAVGVREDGKQSAFLAVFANGVGVAGGGGRRYCGESVGALVCIFGVVGGVGGGVVMEVESE